MTRVQGTLTVTEATAVVLAQLFTWFIADPAEHNPTEMATIIMQAVGKRSALHQIGPGLEVETERDSRNVTVKWSCWYR